MKHVSVVVATVGLLGALVTQQNHVVRPPAVRLVSVTPNVRSIALSLDAAVSRSASRRALHPIRPRAPSAVWRALADCEASGQWHINTGNGYYGGLQITLTNARHYRFARPDLLSPADQVRLARCILRDQGVIAWPVCGPRVGLHHDS